MSFDDYINSFLKQFDSGHYEDALAILTYAEQLAASPQDKMKVVWARQSIAGRLHDMQQVEALEDQFMELITHIYETDDERQLAYYFHIYDIVGYYANDGQILTANILCNQFYQSLVEQYGECNFMNYLYYYKMEQIMFQAENYHAAIQYGEKTCYYLTQEKEELQEIYKKYEAQSDRNVIYVGSLLLYCHALRKIGEYQKSVETLELLKEDFQEGDYHNYILETSWELALCAGYAQNKQYDKAVMIYMKYRTSDFSQYPDLQMMMESLAFLLEPGCANYSSSKANPWNVLHISKDAIETIYFNNACERLNQGQYEQALAMLEKVGDKGLFLQLYAWVKMQKYDNILELIHNMRRYYYYKMEEVCVYYDERYAYSYFMKLNEEFEIILDSLLQIPEEIISSGEIYDFVLNVKAIHYEVAYLSKAYQEDEDFRLNIYESVDIQNSIKDDETLIEYVTAKDTTNRYYVAFVITKESIRHFKLHKKQEIDAEIEQWYRNLNDYEEDSEVKKIDNDTALRKLLYLPMKKHLNMIQKEKLIIAPIMGLANFPFSQLSIQSSRYAGEKFLIAYINTGRELMYKKSENEEAEIFQNPCIIGIDTFASYRPLPYAVEEAKSVARILNTKPMINEKSTLLEVKKRFTENPSVIHISSHGIFGEINDDMMEEDARWNQVYQIMNCSGVVLWNDNLLSASQIQKMDLESVRLCSLSTCHSGTSTKNSPEGYFGMRRSLKIAGVGYIISSLWEVNDEFATLLMSCIYQLLANGVDIESAFKEAIDTLKNYEADPYYWAGFILQR